MKTIAIFTVILGVLALYFVVNVEKSIFLKKANNLITNIGGSEVIPAGINIPKLIFKTGQNITPKGDMSQNIIEVIKEKTSEIFDGTKTFFIENTAPKITNSIKESLKSKINEVVCPIQ